jgi:hypothetical protein
MEQVSPMRFLPVVLLFLTAAATAADGSKENVPPPPPMPANPPAAQQSAPPPPPEGGAEEVIEPQVTIVQRGENVVEEYRAGGRLYMVRITPPKGYAYFLVDTDGDGNLETRRNDRSLPPIPQWVLFRW